MSNVREDLRTELIKIAKKRETVTYGELEHKFGIPRGHAKEGIGIGDVVGDISEYEIGQGRPPLSSVVVLKESKGIGEICPKGHPSGGFLGLSCTPQHLMRSKQQFHDKLTEEDQQYVRDKQGETWEYWESHDP